MVEMITSCKLNVAIYCRVSTDKQDAATQLRDIYTIAPQDAEVIYERQSAWKDSLKVRPEFKALKERIIKGTISQLYVWDFDRLYRNRKAAIAFLQLCDYHNCKIYSYRQKWFKEMDKIPPPWDEMIRRLVFEILAWIAEEESEKLSDRVKKTVVRKGGVTKSYKGKKWGRPEVKINMELVDELRTQGKSIREIAKIMKVSRDKIHRVIKSMT